MSPSPVRTGIVDEVSTPAAFWVLPNELLFLIIQDLDNASILNLGLTCRLMNSIAFNYFFLKNNIQVSGCGLFSDPPRETLPILRSALFIKRLSHFNFKLNPGIERMRSEVSDIRILAARLQAMGAVSIHFPHVKQISSIFPRLPLQFLSMDSWYKAVSRLLVTILERGCNELRVIGGTQFSNIYRDDTPPRKALQLTKPEVNTNQQGLNSVVKESCIVRPRKLSLNLFRRIGRRTKSQAIGNKNVPPVTVETGKEDSGEAQTTNIAADSENASAAPKTKPALPSKCKLRLEEVYIHSDMLLQHPFSQWTLLMLNTASETITKLSLKLTMNAKSTWKLFSATLSLPLLRTFSFTNDFFISSDVALFTDIEDFLLNHPGIKHLSLYGVGLPPSSAVPRPRFQHLISIDAHPFYIIWVMNSLPLNPDPLPNLQRVTISSDNYPRFIANGNPDFDDWLFDSALEAISSFPKNIALTLTFNSKSHIENWIDFHVRAGVERSVISRLVHITRVSISNNIWHKFTDATLANIPDWLALFPALKYFQFEWELAMNEERLTEPQYLAMISILCPKLEMIEVNWRMFDLRLIRKNLGACDGADR